MGYGLSGVDLATAAPIGPVRPSQPEDPPGSPDGRTVARDRKSEPVPGTGYAALERLKGRGPATQPPDQ